MLKLNRGFVPFTFNKKVTSKSAEKEVVENDLKVIVGQHLTYRL